MITNRFKVQDQIDSKTNEFIESIIEKYGLKGDAFAEVKYRFVCPQHKEHASDDLIVEILYHDQLIAMQYQRRDDFNWTEVTNIDCEISIDKDKYIDDDEEGDYYIDENYYCGACGSHSHKCDSQTGCCYECGADAWEDEPGFYPA